MKVTNIRHFGFFVYNLDKMLDFYKNIGFEVFNEGILEKDECKNLLDSEGRLKWIKLKVKGTEGLTGLIEFWYVLDEKIEPTEDSINHIALTVDNIEEVYNNLKDKIKFVSPPQLSKTGKCKLCFCTDPESNPIEFVEEVK